MTDEIEQSPALDKQIDDTAEATPVDSQNATENGDMSEQNESADKSDQGAAGASGAFDPYNLPEHARMPFPPPPGFPHPMHSMSLPSCRLESD